MKRLESIVKKDFNEHNIYEDIIEIVKDQVSKIKKTKAIEPGQIVLLEKLAKIYAILKDDLREDQKSDLWKKLGVVS